MIFTPISICNYDHLAFHNVIDCIILVDCFERKHGAFSAWTALFKANFRGSSHMQLHSGDISLFFLVLSSSLAFSSGCFLLAKRLKLYLNTKLLIHGLYFCYLLGRCIFLSFLRREAK